MGVRIDGSNDVVSAADGTLTVDGLSLNVTGIITASGGFKVGSAYTAYSNGNVETTGIITTTGGLVVETDGVERGRFTSSNQFVIGPRGSARTNFDNGTVSSNLLHIERQGTGSNTGASFLSNTPHADSGAVLYMAKSRSTDNSSATIVSSGDQLGRISFQGADGSNYVEAASIRGHVDGTPGSDDMPGRLSFRTTADGATSATERLRIKSDGDVYIGNIAHANDAGANSSYRTLTLTDTTNGAQVHLRGQSPKLFMDVTSSGNAEMYYDSADLRILSGEPGDAGSTERLRITNGGDVGIGTDDPSRRLELAQSNSTAYSATDFDKDYQVLKLRNYTNDKSVGMQFLIGTNGEAAITAHEEDSDGATTLAFGVRNSGSRAERMRIDSSGRVLIGTTSAVDSSDENLAIVSGGNTQLTLARNDTSVGDGHTLAQIKVFGNDSNGTYQECARIGFEADDNHATDDKPTRMVFETTTAGASSPTERLRISHDGHVLPGADDTYDLGSTGRRWANIYSADLQLSNEGSSNDVDGTWGQYTIQEGENDLFLLNRRNGKKYKFMLQEVD